MACLLVRVWRQRRLATLIGICVALIGASMVAPAEAKSGRDGKRDDAAYIRPAGTPVMAVVSINQQRVTVYDVDGPMLRSAISTGKPGYETPPGIFTVLEKKVEHYSNIYYDAAMPYMQRITWSGIALHAGVLPGHPASGGCIRMPIGFAQQLFERTKMGMRVIVVRDDISPVEIAHPALFKPLPEEGAPVTASLTPGDEGKDKTAAGIVDAAVATDAAPQKPRQSLRSIAAAKQAEAAAAAKQAEEARRAVVKARADAARLPKSVRRAEVAKAKAEARLRQAERWAADDDEDASDKARAQEEKAAAQAALAEAQAQLDALKAQAEPAQELVVRLIEEAKAAEAARAAAVEEAREAAKKLAPISVLISRKTLKLYVRQAREPLFETDVTIADADNPLGSYVFTANGKAETELRWSVVSMYQSAAGPDADEKSTRPRGDRNAAAIEADVAGAKLALGRIAIPKDAMDRISEVVGPGSSLIVTDEPISRETGKYTDFIVVMSKEPQGGLKIRRRRELSTGYRFRRSYDRPPYSWGGSWSW